MLVELFYHIDEFCKIFEKNLSKKLISGNNHVRNRECRLSLSEIMTICAYFHYSKYKTFKDYYCKYVLVHMQSDFKGLVSYNRFIELKPRTVLPFAILAKFFCSSKCTGISFIDSFSLAVCDNRRIHSHKVFKGIAQRGKTSMGWFFGFKLHFAINHIGEIIDFYLSPGNVADNNAHVLEILTQKIFGKLFGDKGYIVRQEIFEKLYSAGVQLITKLRKNMQNMLIPLEDKLILRKRGTIESVIGILKESFSIEHSRHRSPMNFLSHVASSLTAYFFRPNKPSIAHVKPFISQKA